MPATELNGALRGAHGKQVAPSISTATPLKKAKAPNTTGGAWSHLRRPKSGVGPP
jgi:hypothetical protein